MLRRSLSGPQPAEHCTDPVGCQDQSLAGFNVALAQETSSHLSFARKIGGMSEESGSINTYSSGGLDKRHGF
jgi:hypothetical protein